MKVRVKTKGSTFKGSFNVHFQTQGCITRLHSQDAFNCSLKISLRVTNLPCPNLNILVQWFLYSLVDNVVCLLFIAWQGVYSGFI